MRTIDELYFVENPSLDEMKILRRLMLTALVRPHSYRPISAHKSLLREQKMLFEACYKGDVKTVRLWLLDHGISNVNLIKYVEHEHKLICGVHLWEGATCLHIAANRNHHDLMRVLIREFQGDINLRDSEGNTPLHLLSCSAFDLERIIKVSMESIQHLTSGREEPSIVDERFLPYS